MMKKTIFSLFLLVFGVVAWAQPKVPRELQFGAIGGANLSSYSLSPSVMQSKALGYTAGVGVRYIEEKYFGLQCELHLTRRGIRDRYDDSTNYNFERQLLYVELPVLAHVYFNLGKRSEIALDLGAKLGYFVDDKKKGNVDDAFYELHETSIHRYAHHTLDIAQKLDYGIQAGLGYEYRFNRDLSLQVQGRYYFGLGDIFPSAKGEVFESSYNQSVQIVMALWFHHRIRIKKSNQ